jgi:predicted regulator of Ras-like GTPase activity (Roadblock/LC7/MglB family)
MHSVLQSLHTVPGIIGGLLSDDDGGVLAHSFPPIFDLSSLQTISSGLNYNIMGLQDATGGVKLLDLRFEHGRIIVKPIPNHFLLMLCEPNLNLQLLSISMNVAIKKIEKLITQSPKPLPLAAASTPSAPQAQKTQQAAAASPKPKKPINFDPVF